MIYRLRKLIEMSCHKNLLADMPDIHIALRTARDAFALAGSEEQTAVLMASSLDTETCAARVLACPHDAFHDVWVEMMPAASQVALLDKLPGTQLLCGSAINPQSALAGVVLDMFLFIAVVKGMRPATPIGIEQVKSLSVSPLQVRLSCTPGAGGVFQYKKIGNVQTNALERALVTRDLMFHKLAINLFCTREGARNTA